MSREDRQRALQLLSAQPERSNLVGYLCTLQSSDRFLIREFAGELFCVAAWVHRNLGNTDPEHPPRGLLNSIQEVP